MLSDLLLDHKVSTESVVRGKTSPEMLRVLEAVAARADEHLTNCRFRSTHCRNFILLNIFEKIWYFPGGQMIDPYRRGCFILTPASGTTEKQGHHKGVTRQAIRSRDSKKQLMQTLTIERSRIKLS